MKLHEILEMAMAGGTHPEYGIDQVNDAKHWFNDGTVTPIEGGKFSIIRKGNSFAIKRESDNQIMGWVLIDNTIDVFGTLMYPLVNIQILPEYRNTIASFMLINGVREILDRPVLVNNTIFVGGQRLLNAMAKRPTTMPAIYTLDKTTGDKKPYKADNMVIDDNTAFVLEQSSTGVAFKSYLPGGQHMIIVVSLFEGMYTGLIE